MTMREKIARALAADAFQRQASDAEKRRGPSAFLDGWWKHYLGATDAVLDIMREPAEQMIEAGLSDGFGLNVAGQGLYRAAIKRAWPAMVDAAKEEK